MGLVPIPALLSPLLCCLAAVTLSQDGPTTRSTSCQTCQTCHDNCYHHLSHFTVISVISQSSQSFHSHLTVSSQSAQSVGQWQHYPHSLALVHSSTGAETLSLMCLALIPLIAHARVHSTSHTSHMQSVAAKKRKGTNISVRTTIRHISGLALRLTPRYMVRVSTTAPAIPC